MHLDAPTLWWLMVGIAILAELLTGTFYLMMLAVGLAAGAQVMVSAVVGVATVLGAYYRRRHNPKDPPAQANRNINLDIGETVQVDAWQPDGTASVKYRGASWTAIRRPGTDPVSGPHRVAELQGNRLLVEPL
jgi:membrane protein implicated in regulation of membrane protease activity